MQDLNQLASMVSFPIPAQNPSATEQHLAYSNLTASIDEQKKWLTANKLKLNPDKTIALLVSSSTSTNKPSASFPLIVDGLPITPCTAIRNLGVILDSHLTLDLQINSSCKKAYFHLRRIARIKKFLTTPSLIQLVRALVLSQLDYGNSILVGLPACRLEKIATSPELCCPSDHGFQTF